MNYSLYYLIFIDENFYSLFVVLRPVNLQTEILITLKPKEHHYERSTLLFDIQIPQLNFHFNTKQISDILDFIKFQNLTKIHGMTSSSNANRIASLSKRSMSRIS